MIAKVLVAEDNKTNMSLMRKLINHCGLEILEATDGAECINMVKEQRPDLILMDLQMPVMDGYSAIKTLKSDSSTNDIPIIAVTSFAMKGDREKVLESGANDYISKPIDIKQVISLIEKYVKIENHLNLKTAEQLHCSG